jgi:hypothetical protein
LKRETRHDTTQSLFRQRFAAIIIDRRSSVRKQNDEVEIQDRLLKFKNVDEESIDPGMLINKNFQLGKLSVGEKLLDPGEEVCCGQVFNQMHAFE